MTTTTVGHCDSAATMHAQSAVRSARGGKLNLALRGAVLCVALGFGAVSLPAFADSRVVIRVGPPAMQIEEMPAARAGYLWAPGYWRWHNRQHVWAKGHWVRERHGQRYEGARWEQRGDRYHFSPGRWQRGARQGG